MTDEAQAAARVRLAFDAKGGVSGTVYVHQGDSADDLAEAVKVAQAALTQLQQAGSQAPATDARED